MSKKAARFPQPAWRISSKGRAKKCQSELRSTYEPKLSQPLDVSSRFVSATQGGGVPGGSGYFASVWLSPTWMRIALREPGATLAQKDIPSNVSPSKIVLSIGGLKLIPSCPPHFENGPDMT